MGAAAGVSSEPKRKEQGSMSYSVMVGIGAVLPDEVAPSRPEGVETVVTDGGSALHH